MGLQNGGLLTHCMKPPKFNYLVYSNINLVFLSLVIFLWILDMSTIRSLHLQYSKKNALRPPQN